MDDLDDTIDEPTPDKDRPQAIARVVEQVRSARCGGERLDDQLIISAHDELMPELGHELDKLRRIEAAWAAAASPAPAAIAGKPPEAVGEAEVELARAISADLERPTIEVPGFTVLREIGRGGQAVVFLAMKRNFDKRLALKVMRDGSLADDSTIARFRREAGVLGKLYHPNIVTIFETGLTADGSHYFTMDYIAGCSLGDYMQGRQTNDGDDPSALLRLFMQICDAVNAAHSLGIVHRDLKPANIRVDESGEPHILDFGLARTAHYSTGNADPVSITGDFLGSLPWSSPEQAEGDSRKIDARTDVYSLGVILYQMLTGGQFPYVVVGNVRDVLNNIVTTEPTPPSKVAATLSADSGGTRKIVRIHPAIVNEAIEKIVLKALAKRPDQRYQNAGELGGAVADYLLGRNSIAPVSATARPQRQPPGWMVHRRIAVIATLISILATGGIVWQFPPEEGARMKSSRLLKSLVLLVTASAFAAPQPQAVAPRPTAAHRAPFAEHLARAEASVRALDRHLVSASWSKAAQARSAELAERARKLARHHEKAPVLWKDYVRNVSGVIVIENTAFRSDVADQEAERAAAALGDDLNALWARRRQVETERIMLWSKIAFRAVAEMELSEQPLYRFELKATTGNPLDLQRMEALKAAVQFARVVDHLATQAQDALDADPRAVYLQWHKSLAAARLRMQDKMLLQSLVALDVYKPETDAGELAADAKQLVDLARTLVDAERALAAAENAGDDMEADANRAQLQQALAETAGAVTALHKSVVKAAGDWGIAGIPGTKAAVEELPELVATNTAAGPTAVPPPPLPVPEVADVPKGKSPSAFLETVVRESAQVNSSFYAPEPLVAQSDRHQFGPLPTFFQQHPAIVYGHELVTHSGVAKFEVTKTGHLLLACNFGGQGNSSGTGKETRVTREDLIAQGWQIIDDAALGGTLIRNEGSRHQVVFVKHVERGEKYNLRCNKYDPPYVIVFNSPPASAPRPIPVPAAPATVTISRLPQENILSQLVPHNNGSDPKTLEGGAIRLSHGEFSTHERISVPFRADVEAMTDSVNLRLKFKEGELIFNWESVPTELRHADPFGKVTSVKGKGNIPVNTWVHVTWIIQEDVARVYLNGEELSVVHGDYKSVEGFFRVYPVQSTITVKSITIEKLPPSSR